LLAALAVPSISGHKDENVSISLGETRARVHVDAMKADRRAQRSRTALMTTFVDLLLSEGYDAVTVERIAERANVGRSTFYLHYTGKDDILKQSMMRPSSHLATVVGCDLTPDILVPVLNHFFQQRKTNRVFFISPIRPLWVKCLAEMIEPRLALVARHGRGRPVLPLPLIALQLAEAQIGLIAGWLMATSATKPEAVAESLIASTRAITAALLRVASDATHAIPGEKIRFAHQDR
jgi:AcrR family transcriptional regulator